MENIVMKNKNVWQSLVIIFNAKSTFFSVKNFFNGSSSPKAKKIVCIKKTRLISAFEIEVDNNHCKFSKLHHFLNFSRESCQCAMQTSQLALKYEILLPLLPEVISLTIWRNSSNKTTKKTFTKEIDHTSTS